MIKKGFLLCFLLPIISFGQETLGSLTYNVDIMPAFKLKAGNDLDSTFLFNYNNLEVPVFDDFSTNKWVKYAAEFNGSNVTSSLYYYLIEVSNSTPIDPAIVLCDSAYRDTVYIVNDTVVGMVRTSFTTGFDVVVNDLSVFPISGPIKKLYNECYTIVDTVIDGVLDVSPDTLEIANKYYQDSARVFFADITNNDIWIDDYACHNYKYGVVPKSLGVATFDGLNNNGYPYDFGSPNSYGEADFLTSKPINLLGKSNIYLSFLYQPRGLGNSPEAIDSLILEMYSPAADQWYNVWGVSGDATDDVWGMAHLEITANTFKQNGFQFRFKNKASLSGNLDHWHIDYVNLRENSSVNDTIISDLAITYPIETLLKDYTAVPWDHYNNLSDPNIAMVPSYEMMVSNSDVVPKFTNAGTLEMDGNNFSLPVASLNWNVGQNLYPFNVGLQPYAYPQNSSVDKAEFDVKMNIATSSTNQHLENDTTYFTQYFRNYYAYDDASAESGYGLLDNNAEIAIKFEAYEADTLTGVLMKFVPNVSDVTGNVILLTVWGDDEGKPGDILYQDDFFKPHFPDYAAAKNQFKYYTFNDNKAIVVPKVFYVGFEQIEDKNLYLGFDKNNLNQDKNFYNTGSGWSNSSFPGSIMVRPVFSTGLNYTLNVVGEIETTQTIAMYPNPVSQTLTIDGFQNTYSVQIHDVSGKLIYTGNESHIDFVQFSSGFYLVSILDENKELLHRNKIIKP
ncbi:hypothetical protein DNU06_09370 [Putridiphycobacter roseus]|uniref:Secretion system C-terminal sorting domain-containing protein n=1 Tax=Putridiphycobacter roseus TaxID=2219161 RepID=A0A2W1N071_9FLAO|nr:T9SS type A sorting domain-containing protein [Putridiphycobacter roseus]PZE16950.1 hypothetical protein DNU06_09370 [Putridiphycobacter roseus]